MTKPVKRHMSSDRNSFKCNNTQVMMIGRGLETVI